MNYDETGAVLQMLAAAYRQQLDDHTHEVWAAVLADKEPGYVLKAAQRWVTTSDWFPKPAELLRDVEQLERADELKEAQERRRLAAFRCDGSRWMPILDDEGEHTGEARPCPTCNPALAELWQDSTKWNAWRQGHRFAPPEGMALDVLPCEQHVTAHADKETAAANIAALKARMVSWTSKRRT